MQVVLGDLRDFLVFFAGVDNIDGDNNLFLLDSTAFVSSLSLHLDLLLCFFISSIFVAT